MGEIPSSPFLFEMKLWDCTTEEGKKALARAYKQLAGREFRPPRRKRRAISCDVKVESLGEIGKLMRQTPNYTISKQGRG